MGTGGGIKWSEREADQSPVFSAEVSNVWSYTSIPSYDFMARCLIKFREALILTSLGGV
jgi:hypothetical protein